MVLAASITHIEAEENYSRVHMANHEPMLVRRTMAEWKRLLPRKYFLRVDRSTLVNKGVYSAVKRGFDRVKNKKKINLPCRDF